ncbi:zinc finger CCCH domain-containing protein 38 isoform X2 [Cicer arietinum]|uniref:Zinc finger CCCH domain-containing protein 55 isoform X2 n=1 Tax=Cicer arietinum TaxID=3827 RepID=A0A3Q7XDY8_CICAR|nr:zinc finger CCCH domain-containing protein 55 isoform X2 [Cicer arietinum]
MSGSCRKLSSKWDSGDESEFASESVTNSNNSRRPYLASNDMIKPRMEFLSKEPFSGGRGSNRDDVRNEDYRVFDATIAQGTDGSYDMDISPGFEEWKNRKHGQSAKDDYGRRSRSHSRSPPRGFKYSAVDERNRTRAGRTAQPCRDFAVGNCRRGSHCHFLHHDNQSYEDSRESRHRQDGPRYSNSRESGDYSLASQRSNEACINFAKGRCRTGESCKYVHHGNSDGFDNKVSADESSRQREIDRRRSDNSFKQGGQHYPNHSGNTPCKFFAFGNCRNGKDCRFSHDRQAFTSPIGRLRDDRSRSNQGEDQVLGRPKISDSVIPNGRPRDDRWGSDGSMADVGKVWDGPKQNDLVAVSDTAKMVEDNKNGIIGAAEPGFIAWPMSDRRDHSFDKNIVHNESPFSIDKKEGNCSKAENATDNILISQSVGGGIWPGDETMSPDWNYGARSSSHVNDEHGQNKQQVAPGQGLIQNSQNISASQVVGQSQTTVSIVTPRARIIESIQNQEHSTEKNYIVEPNTMNASLSQISSRNTPTQNVVSKEQLAQLSCLSASLAHILGTDQKLPQLHSTSNSYDAKDTLFGSKIEGSGDPVSLTFIKPDPAIGLKQYDTMCDSMGPKNTNASVVPPTFSPIKIPKNAVEIPPQLSNLGQSFDDSRKTAISEEPHVKNEHLFHLQLCENIKVQNETSKIVAEEKPSSQSENKITKENSPLGNMDQNVGPEDAKKTKDAKGTRAFKISLVELIKELLKPTWKDGKITKEDYKAIVKKVTDKVTGTVQRVHIPQTQEKIDRYLSVSKPKLIKLVQAYVEKAQKA